VCDFVTIVKVCQGEIFSLYIALNTKFKSNAFEGYKALVDARHESIIMRWVTNLNIIVANFQRSFSFLFLLSDFFFSSFYCHFFHFFFSFL
jgi:hypothetical protein